MTGLAILAIAAGVAWLVRRRSPRYPGALPNDHREEIDREALTQAEQELAEDPRPRSLGERADDEGDDDWGPGTGR